MKYYKNILDPSSIVYLRNEVEMLTEFQGNYWLGIHDEPENTVEKYIQDSFDSKQIPFEFFNAVDGKTLSKYPVNLNWYDILYSEDFNDLY